MVNFSEMGDSSCNTCTHPRSISLQTPLLSTQSTTPPAMPNLALHQDWHERQILSMCSSVITRTSTTRHDAASEEPPPAPHCLDSAPTQNRRSCETLSPAAPELVAITWTISNRRAEEKCDITDNCLTQEMNQLATHRAIATHAEQLAWRSSDHCRTANATDDNSPSPK